jgi:polysaccharide biosynthesis protein PslE
LGKNQADLAAAKQTTASLREQLAQTPERIGKESRSVQNLALQQIKPELMKLESERSELLTRYQPDSKRIAEINARISASQRILDRENHLEVTEVATDLNPIWVTAKTSYDQSAANQASLQAGHDSLEKEIDEGHQQLTDMANNGMQIERLQRQVDTDKEAYLSYVRKNEEARAAQGLNTNKILNVSLAQAPNDPLQPKFPIVWLNLMLGVMLALGAGTLAAYSEEQGDPRIYSTFTIRQASGAPTVAVLRNDL